MYHFSKSASREEMLEAIGKARRPSDPAERAVVDAAMRLAEVQVSQLDPGALAHVAVAAGEGAVHASARFCLAPELQLEVEDEVTPAEPAAP